MKSTINVKSCEKCIVAHKPASYRSKKVAEMCIECQMQQYKHFKPESQFKEQYFIENKTAELLQYNLNLAKARADFSISKAIANIYNCTDFIEIIIGNLRKLREKILDESMPEESINRLIDVKNNEIEELKKEMMQLSAMLIKYNDDLELKKAI